MAKIVGGFFSIVGPEQVVADRVQACYKIILESQELIDQLALYEEAECYLPLLPHSLIKFI